MHEFKPYVFPLGRRLDAQLDESGDRRRELIAPSLEVEALADAYLVTAVVPGAAKESVAISFEDGVVRVAGEMRWGEAPDDTGFRAFSREVRIERAIDVRRAEAHFENGVLTARLPFATSDEPREEAHALLKVT